MKRKLVSLSLSLLLLLVFAGFSQISARGFGHGWGHGWGCPSYCNAQQRMYQPSYQDLDANADGQVTEQEHALFREKRQASRPGRGYQAEDQDNMFEQMDTNGDAVVTPDEFEQHWEMRRR